MLKMNPSLVTFVYGALVAAGGIMGYVQAKSKESMIAGVLSGVVLIAAGMAMQKGLRWGFILAIIATAGLLLMSAGRYGASVKFMPMGLLAVLSLVALVALILSARKRG